MMTGKYCLAALRLYHRKHVQLHPTQITNLSKLILSDQCPFKRLSRELLSSRIYRQLLPDNLKVLANTLATYLIQL